MRTSFVEVRSSRLLKNPLRISGEYRRPDDATFVREVRAPYVETSTIRGDGISIARGGQKPKTYSLSRAPQLAGMQASFGALLRGDQSALGRDFAITTGGTRQEWRMTLAPKQAALQKELRDITLYGRGAELRCIETRTVRNAEVQRTLLAGAARSVTAATTEPQLIQLCQTSGLR